LKSKRKSIQHQKTNASTSSFSAPRSPPHLRACKPFAT